MFVLCIVFVAKDAFAQWVQVQPSPVYVPGHYHSDGSYVYPHSYQLAPYWVQTAPVYVPAPTYVYPAYPVYGYSYGSYGYGYGAYGNRPRFVPGEPVRNFLNSF